jgi:23S rRNA pseudouridine2605 synthase
MSSRGGAAAEGAGRHRIQKFLAARGIGSRRQVEAWIAAGRISVNGKPARPGQPVGDRRLRLARATETAHQGVAYHRPAQEGVQAGARGSELPSIERLPKAAGRRWIPVSPLPPRDGGLELFVTDGELAAALTRRGGSIPNEFSVRVRGTPDQSDLEQRMQSACASRACRGAVLGVALAGGEGSNRWLQVEVEGLRPRDLREILGACGLEANRILRTRLGPVVMDRGLARGRSRPLTDGEMRALRDAATQRATGSRSRVR